MILLIADFSENINYDDAIMFKCHSISIGLGDAVVVYRCKYDSESRKWVKVNMSDPIHTAGIIVGYHNYPTNEENVNARLQGEQPATTKQRGRPKK